jgi:hypothetical protein
VSTLVTELVLTVVLRRAVRPLAPRYLRPLVEGGALAALLAVTVAFTPGHVFVRAGIGAVLFAAAFGFVLWARRIATTVGKEVRA